MSADIQALIAEIGDQLETLVLTADGLAHIQGTATSPNGDITADVAGDGALIGLWLAESVTTRPPAEVAAAVLETCAQAAAHAAQQRSALLIRLSTALT
ncbi:hypothetical protein [Nocardia acidivorans]|uniref:hypothetical protein n=1 Tax=Nocardia acidivorans TaxID=404580 RepID=UPI0008351A73|nr:hypothetical protein [Nocardia acidivorans]